MTSRERQLAAMRRQQPDRVPLFIRGVQSHDPGWVAARHPSFAAVTEAVREHGDVRSGVGLGGGTFLTATEVPATRESQPSGDWVVWTTTHHTPRGDLVTKRSASPQGHPGLTLEFPVKTEDDVERALSVPYSPVQPAVEKWLAVQENLGERGIVLIGFANALGFAHGMLGSERLAEWSIINRKLVTRLVRAAAERVEDMLRRWLADPRLVEPVFNSSGHEFAGPLLLSPRDFREFCTEVEKPLYRLIHDRGGLVHIHCHGPMDAIIEEFVEMGADCLHPIEPPPMGDLPLAAAKARVGRDLCLEGNIQIGDLLALETKELTARVEQTMRNGMPGGGFILAPSASPYPPALSERAVANYLAMIEAGVRLGRYGG